MPIFGGIMKLDPGDLMSVLQEPIGPDTQEISHDFSLSKTKLG